MALVATVGAATSNSYVTQTEADSYFASGMHEGNVDWAAVADSDGQDEFLIKATYHIDRQRLKGSKADNTLDGSGVPSQALHFPRAEDNDTGTEFIPIEIKQATYEQALFLIRQVSNVRQQLQAEGVKSAKIDDVMETYGGRRGRIGVLGTEAFALVQPFLLRGGNIVF